MGNLSLDQVAISQNAKEGTINTADAQVEDALTNQTTYSVTSLVSPQTLTQAQWTLAMVMEITGTLTGNMVLNVPAAQKLIIVQNNTTGGFNVTIQLASGGSTVLLVPGSRKLIYVDGSNVLTKGGLNAVFGAATSGFPPISGSMLRMVAPFNFTIKAGLPSAVASFSVVPNLSYTVTFSKNGTPFGTLVITHAGSLTWTAASDTSFTVGTDVLSFDCPAQDATLQYLAVILHAVRTS